MRFSLFSLVRLTVLIALSASLVAVGLARMEPKGSHFRLGMPPHYLVINGFSLGLWSSEIGFLDTESGQFAHLPMPTGDRLEYGACSPWQDDDGECQVVGRWIRETGDGKKKRCDGMGLARYSLPSGRVMDRIALEVMPSGYPCWFPGLTAKVLFAAANGQLYTMTFSDRPDDDTEPTLRPVVWKCAVPGAKLVVRDPVWPVDARLGGRLIVSLSYQTHADGLPISTSQLWWLSLSSDGSKIIDAGPISISVSDPEETEAGFVELRFPNLAVNPVGDLVLTYLRQRPGRGDWHLNLAFVSASPTTAPVILKGTTRTLTDHHISAVAPFSTDGRWIYAISKKAQGGSEIVRVSTDSTETRRD